MERGLEEKQEEDDGEDENDEDKDDGDEDDEVIGIVKLCIGSLRGFQVLNHIRFKTRRLSKKTRRVPQLVE